MSQNKPLTDIDRWDWLISLREAAAARLSPSGSSATKPHDGVVVTCSALKRKYRDVIRIAAYNNHSVLVHFIYLRASEEVLIARVLGRTGHYMKSGMVHSQMEMLEEPDQEEQGRDVLEVDCGASLSEVQRMVVRTVREVLAEDVWSQRGGSKIISLQGSLRERSGISHLAFGIRSYKFWNLPGRLSTLEESTIAWLDCSYEVRIANTQNFAWGSTCMYQKFFAMFSGILVPHCWEGWDEAGSSWIGIGTAMAITIAIACEMILTALVYASSSMVRNRAGSLVFVSRLSSPLHQVCDFPTLFIQPIDGSFAHMSHVIFRRKREVEKVSLADVSWRPLIPKPEFRNMIWRTRFVYSWWMNFHRLVIPTNLWGVKSPSFTEDRGSICASHVVSPVGHFSARLVTAFPPAPNIEAILFPYLPRRYLKISASPWSYHNESFSLSIICILGWLYPSKNILRFSYIGPFDKPDSIRSELLLYIYFIWLALLQPFLLQNFFNVFQRLFLILR